jgi:hypothetical protein
MEHAYSHVLLIIAGAAALENVYNVLMDFRSPKEDRLAILSVDGTLSVSMEAAYPVYL